MTGQVLKAGISWTSAATEPGAQTSNLRRLRSVATQVQVKSCTWKSVGAVLGLALGLTAPLAGALLTVITWFAGNEWHRVPLYFGATLMFGVTLPLLIIGAHCLDLMDKEADAIRSKNYERKDDDLV